MPLNSSRPQLVPDQVFISKEAAGILGVSHKTFLKYRDMGLITPINPGSTRPKYFGRDIMQCYDAALLL